MTLNGGLTTDFILKNVIFFKNCYTDIFNHENEKLNQFLKIWYINFVISKTVLLTLIPQRRQHRLVKNFLPLKHVQKSNNGPTKRSNYDCPPSFFEPPQLFASDF